MIATVGARMPPSVMAPPAPPRVRIRPYRAGDEEEVREICYRTGFLGRPVPLWIDANRALFTDLWLDYYLRREPESIWVAEAGGEVVGYLTGCLDSRRKRRYMTRMFPLRALGWILTGRWRCGSRSVGLAGRLLLDRFRHGAPRFPGDGSGPHVHYNIREGFRGGELVGVRLLATFCRGLLARGITSCAGLTVMTEREMDSRYRSIGSVFDSRRTTAYANADPRPLYLVVVHLDDITGNSRHSFWRRTWRWAAATGSDGGPAAP